MARPTFQRDYKSNLCIWSRPTNRDHAAESEFEDRDYVSDGRHRQRMVDLRDWVLEAPVHLAVIGSAVSGTVAALVLVFRPGFPAEDLKWACLVRSDLWVAVAGFAFGKVAK